MKLLIISLLIGISSGSKLFWRWGAGGLEGDPGPKYDCTHCQPEQMHIAFGGKYFNHQTSISRIFNSSLLI